MRRLLLLAFSLGAIGWPVAPALACQSTYQEDARREQKERHERERADVVVVGTLDSLEGCEGFGHWCAAQLTVDEVRRGDSVPQLAVRYKTTYDMCDGRLWPGTKDVSAVFYLDRDKKSGTYSLVQFERIEAKEPTE